MKTELQKIGDDATVILPQSFLDECGIQKLVDIRLENNRIIIQSPKSKKYRAKGFVEFVLKLCNSENTGAKATLKSADNKNRQDKSYEYLAPFFHDKDVQDLENETEYLAYATIAAAIAKAEITKNGYLGIGRAIARCYDEKNQQGYENNQAKTKLRRLLACDTSEEVCRILRPLFSLIDAKELAHKMNYIKLLSELEKFHFDENRERTKRDWAKDFYGRLANKNKNDEDNQ